MVIEFLEVQEGPGIGKFKHNVPINCEGPPTKFFTLYINLAVYPDVFN